MIKTMTKSLQFQIINERQERYVNELIDLILGKSEKAKAYKRDKIIYFNSDTGTGKSHMESLLISKMDPKQYFFIVTTLSKGQLNTQLEDSINKLCPNNDNYYVYGTSSLKRNTHLTPENLLSIIPKDKKLIWIKDEGHQMWTNWDRVLEDKCYKIVSFSATNKYQTGINCNFKDTCMRRRINQIPASSPKDALEKLIEIKKVHSVVPNYNPCCIMRILNDNLIMETKKECDKLGLSYIDITNDAYDMEELCKDDSPIDVIFNKMKLVEGVDIRRAQVLFSDNFSQNPATIIQYVGRICRNALLYNDSIDIFAPENKLLFKETMQAYVYFSDFSMCRTDENGIVNVFSNLISIQQLESNISIDVVEGKMENGLTVMELRNRTGHYNITIDPKTHFNVVDNPSFYKSIVEHKGEKDGYYVSLADLNLNILGMYLEDNYNDYFFIKKTKEITSIDFDKLNYLKIEKYLIDRNVKFKKQYWRDKFYINNLEKTVKNGNELFLSLATCLNKSSKISILDLFKYSAQEEISKKEALVLKQGHNMSEVRVKSMVNILVRRNNRYYIDPEFIPYIKAIECNVSYVSMNYISKVSDNLSEVEIKSNKSKTKPKLELSPSKIINNKCDYDIMLNDRELSIISVEPVKYFSIPKDPNSDADDLLDIPTGEYVQDRSISSQIGKSCKFNTYISNVYKKQIENLKKQIKPYNYYELEFSGDLRRSLTAAVSYLSQLYIMGRDFFDAELEIALEEYKKNFRSDEINDAVLIRAALLKYKYNMIDLYGRGVTLYLRLPSIVTIKLCREYIDTVVNLATKTANFLQNKIPNLKEKMMSNLFVFEHLLGMAQIITKNCLIEIRPGAIGDYHIKRTMAYYYCSTKMSCYNIKKIIIYDPISEQCLETNI